MVWSTDVQLCRQAKMLSKRMIGNLSQQKGGICKEFEEMQQLLVGEDRRTNEQRH